MADPGSSRELRPTRGHWGKRKRRLRWVVYSLVALTVVGVVGGVLIHRATRPEVRRPGEALPEITERLSRNIPAEAPTPRFTDVTAVAGLAGFRSFVGDRSSQLPEDMGSGVAWGDFDNDGDDDLFLVSAGGALSVPPEERAPSELYENLGDGTFSRVDDFPETRIVGMGAAWGDYDGDGWLDLVVSGYGGLRLFRNERGRMVRVDALPEVSGYWSGVSWGDFDNDRDLDLYVCGYVQYIEDTGDQRRATEQYGTAVPYTLNPATFEPERNLLFQNRGDGTFDEVAELFGVSNPGGRSLGALWRDFDDDGWLDLYVANDISDNALYLNRQETFEDVSLAAWVADYRGAMGLAAGDWNRDGDDDLFVTHWLAQENALYDSRLADVQGTAAVQLTFTDQAVPLGLGQIALHMVGWGTEFADLDADGWLDLLVVNGSTLETATEPKGLKPQPAMLLWNQEGRYFHDLAPLAPDLAKPRVGRGMALSDYDGDGDLDILSMELYSGVVLLRNDMEQGNWLGLRLRSTGPGGEAAVGFGDGATARVRLGELTLRRSVTSASYLSQSTRTLHFGLGDATGVESVEIRWLGGESESWGPLEGGAVWELTEGDPEPRRLSGPVAMSATASGAGMSEEVAALGERERTLKFWETQRAAMDAIKKEGDLEKAVPLLRQALELNPGHLDSRYYLANCQAALGHPEEALAELDRLRKINPGSHRAHKQWGVLRAVTAESPEDLEAASEALERALEINQEGAGSLHVLGEIALLQGDPEKAEQRLEWVCRTNPKAVGAYYLRGYLAWTQGREEEAVALLESASVARGPDWVPEGAVAEGDVQNKMHREISPLSDYWEAWDGGSSPEEAFRELDERLAG